MAARVLRVGALAIVLLVASCGSGDDDGSGASADLASADETDAAEAVDAPTAPDEPEEIIAELNAYWSAADDELGFSYTPIDLSRVSEGNDGVLCDGQEISMSDVEGNAFVDAGCAEGLVVAYDPDEIDDSLAAAEATLAHEWGHVIQAQHPDIDPSLGPEGLPIDAELQADCFAGAWAAQWAVASIDAIRIDVAGSGDEASVAVDDPDAHGTPSERREAFDVGVERGPVGCVGDFLGGDPGY